ncbi:hypothetical protein SARC_00611 [Sphaeroforma arctica JP610]|uniref:RGS domain-containing protein n=1 Tax=Sphaeroforma arctica JP610 TaxID=667725 RepID=A0A0L0GG69_9EUKA|nr:hypothetical protein SARC_00611 [Sphaeroforma arctica JP610]KNC87283.1 hypothetical protein SARC_00611 [Sphaeroforma arctica JP610]|eukprot:XP_014161185.1 hypothetical protein SARC_00611 [Sphaeroforma arctica JP610]
MHSFHETDSVISVDAESHAKAPECVDQHPKGVWTGEHESCREGHTFSTATAQAFCIVEVPPREKSTNIEIVANPECRSESRSDYIPTSPQPPPRKYLATTHNTNTSRNPTEGRCPAYTVLSSANILDSMSCSSSTQLESGNVYTQSDVSKYAKISNLTKRGAIDIVTASPILDNSAGSHSGTDAYNSAVCLSERTRRKNNIPVRSLPSSDSNRRIVVQWWHKYKTNIYWLLVWIPAWIYAGIAHFYFENLLTENDNVSEAESKNIWLKYSMNIEPYLQQVYIYFGVIYCVTMLMVLTVCVLVTLNIRDPALAVLNPIFLFHVCSMSVLILVADLNSQYSTLTYSNWINSNWRLALNSFIISFCLQFFIMAPLLRLRAMYLVFIKSVYDVQYKWLVLRAVVQCAVTNCTIWLAFGPPEYFWLIGWGARVGFALIVIEIIFYVVTLRNCKYLQKQFAMTLHMCIVILFTLCYIGLLLALLHPTCNMPDQFHAIIILVWVTNMELIGPALWQTYWVRLKLSYNSKRPTPRRGSLVNSGLDPIMQDGELYEVLLVCAKKRFCEEILLFIRDTDNLLAFLGDGSEECLATSVVEEKERRAQAFLEKYVLPGAAYPVNIASGQIASFMKIYAGIIAKKGLLVSELVFVLEQSLKDLIELFESSGVLTMYDNSESKREIIKVRQTVARLGFVVVTESTVRM